MQIKTFRGASLQEALQRVRQEFGPDASVLNTREVPQRRVFGRSHASIIEVQAGLETETHGGSSAPAASLGDTPELPADATSDSENTDCVIPDPATPNSPAVERSTACRDAPARGARENLQLELISCGLSTDAVNRLLEALDSRGADADSEAPTEDDRAEWLLQLRREMARSLQVTGAPPIDAEHPHTQVFIGPTGVGKTSALAKVAHQLHAKGREIGLMTVDTVRPGAVDQLLALAERLEARLEVVSAAEQIADAIERLRACDVRLVDTSGFSTGQSGQLDKMTRWLSEMRAQAVHLVIEARMSQANIRHTIDRWRPAQATDLVITKVDEAIDFGSWYSLLSEDDCLPVSYLSAGQFDLEHWQVPSAFELATALTKSVEADTPPASDER